MTGLIAALAIWAAGAVAGLLLRGRPAWSGAIGVLGSVAGALAGLVAASSVLFGGAAPGVSLEWPVPFGRLSLALDPLSAAFLVPICVVGALAAVHARGYFEVRASTHPPGPRLAAFNLLLASMALVVAAAHPLPLLFGWEGMTLASWALVVSDHEAPAVRRAGQLYLFAAHVATAALVLLFISLPESTGWRLGAIGPALPAAALVGLALVGFGTKAGIVPFHVWLPDAHSAAPGPVSALMSGVLITLGFYGLARFLPLIGPGTPGTAAVLIVLGVVGAVGAIAHALVQRDVKRMLAYSTVENAGLVTIAIGCARLAEAMGHPRIAALAWAAALFHLWNHALFKSVLFIGVGAAAQATGTRDLEAWGGGLRRWPLAGALVMVGGAGMAGLPPFGGFVSEWLILSVLFAGALALQGWSRAAMVLSIAVVAGTAALALAGAARLLGIGWLGSPRDPEAAGAPPLGPSVTTPMAILAALTLLAGCFPGALAGALEAPVRALVPGSGASLTASLVAPLGLVSAISLAAILGLSLLRAALAARRPARSSVTWDCGYARPDPSMQYTGSSLSEPLARQMAPLLRTRVRWSGALGFWPASASWRSQTLDRAITDLYRPLAARFTDLLERLRELQEPHVTTHLRYMVLALLIVLALLFLPLPVRP